MLKGMIIAITALSLTAVFAAAFNASLGSHQADNIKAGSYYIDADSNGNPDCGDALTRNIATSGITPIRVSQFNVYHPISQIQGITDANNNNWPDYCENVGPQASGTPFSGNVFHPLYYVTTGSSASDFSVDSNNNGCFDYCDCLPTDMAANRCYNNDVYSYNCRGDRIALVQDCGEDSCPSYDLSTMCWSCATDGKSIYKAIYCTDRGCNNDACFAVANITSVVASQACTNSCARPKCFQCPSCSAFCT
jgi:hypothetical protein